MDISFTKSKFVIVKMILLFSVAACMFSACTPNEPEQKAYFIVEYNATEGGYIQGKKVQEIEIGKDAEAVTAVAKEGYYFKYWSDGKDTVSRQELNVTDSISATAIFEQNERFIYNYNYATSNNEAVSIILQHNKLDETKCIVPQRDYFTFDGWYLDKEFTKQATDKTGKFIIGSEIFENQSRDLYAKWTVIDKYVVTYKILMVYVTQIDATLTGKDGSNVELHYKMSDMEKEVCQEITKQFALTINDFLDGLVKFEVDSYFTTQTVGIESFTYATNAYYISAEGIPELIDNGILDNYRSVITTFSFDNKKNLLPGGTLGLGDKKFAKIYFDKIFSIATHDKNILEEGHYEIALDPEFNWDWTMDTYVHEFIHTIEQGLILYEFHSAIGGNNRVIYSRYESKYQNSVGALEAYKLYLLNQCPINLNEFEGDSEAIRAAWLKSEKVGVPYAYWSNEIYTFVVDTKCINDDKQTGGKIEWANDCWIYKELFQNVPKGSRTHKFTAEAAEGYRFIGWSDGIYEKERLITDMQSDIFLTAYFERNYAIVTYLAGDGGKLELTSEQGKLTQIITQNVFLGDWSKIVRAVPNDGFIFVGWSDEIGVEWPDDSEFYNLRRDYISEEKNITVTALFEKIH